MPHRKRYGIDRQHFSLFTILCLSQIELIVNLKRVEVEYELNISRIKEMCEKNGDYLSQSTLSLRFLWNQIELKDKRMDVKDKIINRLIEKCL